jgi:hypothetical protein
MIFLIKEKGLRINKGSNNMTTIHEKLIHSMLEHIDKLERRIEAMQECRTAVFDHDKRRAHIEAWIASDRAQIMDCKEEIKIYDIKNRKMTIKIDEGKK